MPYNGIIAERNIIPSQLKEYVFNGLNQGKSVEYISEFYGLKKITIRNIWIEQFQKIKKPKKEEFIIDENILCSSILDLTVGDVAIQNNKIIMSNL